MELEKLYEIADRENIWLFYAKMNNKAITYEIDNEYCMCFNSSKFDNSIEEKEVLAEELGHYFTNSLYNTYSDDVTIRKKEYRANKWKMKTLVPPSALLKLKEQGYNSYEIADKLDVSENLILSAYNYYKQNGLLD